MNLPSTAAFVPTETARLPVPVKLKPKPLFSPSRNQPINQIDNCFQDFNMRLASFFDMKNPWPDDVSISPLELAKAGFYYTGLVDCVQCFSCCGRMYHFLEGDAALSEHKKHFPKCRFIRLQTKDNMTTVREQLLETNTIESSTPFKALVAMGYKPDTVKHACKKLFSNSNEIPSTLDVLNVIFAIEKCS